MKVKRRTEQLFAFKGCQFLRIRSENLQCRKEGKDSIWSFIVVVLGFVTHYDQYYNNPVTNQYIFHLRASTVKEPLRRNTPTKRISNDITPVKQSPRLRKNNAEDSLKKNDHKQNSTKKYESPLRSSKKIEVIKPIRRFIELGVLTIFIETK